MIIASEVLLPEAYKIDKEVEADIYIKKGPVPRIALERKKEGYVNSIFKLEWYWFFIEKVGDFFIEAGKSITVTPLEGAREKSIRALILGPGLAGIMVQRKMIALHGGAVVKNQKAYLLCGESGAGKSTLVTAFRKAGAKFLADDTVAIREQKNCIMAYPAYPQQKLCEDAACNYGYNTERLFLLDEERKKYAIPLLEEFCEETVPLAVICIIQEAEVEQVSLREIEGHEKLQTVIRNLYSRTLFEMIGMPAECFQTLLSLVQAVPVCILKRPKGKFTPQEQIKLIEAFVVEQENKK